MNYKIALNVLGTIIKFLGISLLIPLIVAVYYNETNSIKIFAISFFITFISGIILENINKSEYHELTNKESIFIVGIGWLMVAIFGGIPFLLSGISPLDSLFESMAGFTTTGSSIFTDIESHSKSLLFWRSMTQWLGGMGIIVLVIAILPKLAMSGRQMFQFESPGPIKDKLKPRLKDTAQILWGVYVTFTLLEIIILKIAGMPLYDAIVHSFSSLSTGGFSPKGESIASYGNILFEFIIIIFMFIGGVNFSLFYRTLRVDVSSLLKDKEFQAYVSIIVGSTLIIAYGLWNMGETIINSFRYSLFQVVSVITTTGFASTDFNNWSDSAKMVLLLLMFVGGSAGSTGGSIKVIRILLLIKYGIREIQKAIHPKLIKPIRLGNDVIPEEVMQAVISFFVLYLFVFVTSSLILVMLGLDLISGISAAATTIGNVGPGFGLFGPMANFSEVHVIGKIVLILNMWIGRLEVLTVLILFVPSFWKK